MSVETIPAEFGPMIGAIAQACAPCSKSDRETTEKIEKTLLERIRSGHEDAPHEMTHTFSPGIYWREIHMHANTILVGREHTTTHLNVVLTGKAEVLIEGKTHLIDATKGPVVFESAAGVRKTLYIIEDMRWATIHANPDNCQDVKELESRLGCKSPYEMEHEKLLKLREENEQ
jgi:hypothetical protein